jgi:hypothetical protein
LIAATRKGKPISQILAKKVTENPTKKCTGIKREEQNNKKIKSCGGEDRAEGALLIAATAGM